MESYEEGCCRNTYAYRERRCHVLSKSPVVREQFLQGGKEVNEDELMNSLSEVDVSPQNDARTTRTFPSTIAEFDRAPVSNYPSEAAAVR